MMYRFAVSIDGRFLFRSDWDDDVKQVISAASLVRDSIQLAKVEIIKCARNQYLTMEF